jgi:hypothetical protein
MRFVNSTLPEGAYAQLLEDWWASPWAPYWL